MDGGRLTDGMAAPAGPVTRMARRPYCGGQARCVSRLVQDKILVSIDRWLLQDKILASIDRRLVQDKILASMDRPVANFGQH